MTTDITLVRNFTDLVKRGCPEIGAVEKDVNKAVALYAMGDAAQEYALAIIARIYSEKTWRDAYRTVHRCLNCQYPNDGDFELPSVCPRSDLDNSSYPPKAERQRRWERWGDLERELIQAGVASHGKINDRCLSYKKLIDLGRTWDEAYRAIALAPTYVKNMLVLGKWDERGNFVGLKEGTMLEVGKGEEPAEVLGDRIMRDVEDIEEDGTRYMKVQKAQYAAELSGKPIVQVWQANPRDPDFKMILTVTHPNFDEMEVTDEFYYLVLMRGDRVVNYLEKDVVHAVHQALRARVPPDAIKGAIYR